MSSRFDPSSPDLVEQVRTVTRDELAPLAHSGPPGRVSRDLLRALGESGVLDLVFPVGPDGRRTPAAARTVCQVREAVAYASTEAEVLLTMQGIGGYPLLQSGQPHQAERWLDPVARGTAVAAFALTEPEAGSDAGALALQAVPDGDGWRLVGEKTWISNAPDADFYTTFARTTDGAGARGVTAFVVPADRAGLSGEAIDLFVPHPLGRLSFDEVPVSRTDVLGEVDRGFRVAMRTFDLFRPSVGAAVVGMGQAAFDATVAHTSTRQAFGAPLSAKQAVAHLLADAATTLSASRLLVHDAAAAYDAGDPRVTAKAAMAKLFATEGAQRVIDTAVQLHGASGLVSGHLIEGLYREIRATRIYEGASEIQRDLIARDLFRPASVTPTAANALKES